jgi:hypothetical protein
MFGGKPRTNVTSPLDKNDHPETDDTELLDEDGIQQYQSIIGSLQCAVSLGRLDVTTAVMTLSSFRALPRRGHLDRAKRVVSYLYRFKFAKIRFRTHEPDFSDLVVPEYDWADAVYGKVKEDIPSDAPTPLGKPVVTVSYVDANLLHCLVTGRSVTGILHFLNGTPIDWYSKKMATVETATYGAEFVSARTCVEQLVDLRNTLRYLGVPLRERSFMFGDNESVVNSSVTPHAKLHKRHNALSFHRVREAIASGIYVFTHIPGENNPADILSKHWGYSSVWHMLKALMFVPGDTVDSPGKTSRQSTKGDNNVDRPPPGRSCESGSVSVSTESKEKPVTHEGTFAVSCASMHPDNRKIQIPGHPDNRDSRVTMPYGKPLHRWRDLTGSAPTWRDIDPLETESSSLKSRVSPMGSSHVPEIRVASESSYPIEATLKSKGSFIGGSPRNRRLRD